MLKFVTVFRSSSPVDDLGLVQAQQGVVRSCRKVFSLSFMQDSNIK